MAKKLQISTDGSTWYDMPGSQGTFDTNADEMDDTILGQTFKSNEIGLIEWTMESDGIFKGFPGYSAKIKKPGTSTLVTGGATTLESGKIYGITDQTKAIMDRANAITVLDGVTDVTDEVIMFDYLFGRFEFAASYSIVGTITVTYNYFPTVVVARGNAFTLTMSADNIDESTFDVVQANGGFKVGKPGLRTVSLEVQGIFAAAEGARALVAARNELILEIDPTGTGSSIARGFFKAVGTGASGAVGAVEDETRSFSLTVPSDTLLSTVFSWKHTSTTLPMAIQLALTSWLTELNTYQARYMPTGVTGASPLDAVKGAVYVTDISLQGSLSGMNIFNMSLMGTGAYTEV